MKVSRLLVPLLFLCVCAGCPLPKKISVSDPFLAKLVGMPTISRKAISYKDMPMEQITRSLKHPDSPYGQKSLAVLVGGERCKEPQAKGTVMRFTYTVLKSRFWRTRYNGVEALECIGSLPGYSLPDYSVCALWEIADFDEKILQERARQALEVLKKFSTPIHRACGKRREKEGFIVFDNSGGKPKPKKPREVFFY
jgi:hypothetical protein